MKTDLLDINQFNGMEELDNTKQEQVDGGLAHLYWMGVGARIVYQAAKNPATRKAATSMVKSAAGSFSKWVGHGAAAGAAKSAYDHYRK